VLVAYNRSVKVKVQPEKGKNPSASENIWGSMPAASPVISSVIPR